jgi:hypothetical protein
LASAQPNADTKKLLSLDSDPTGLIEHLNAHKGDKDFSRDIFLSGDSMVVYSTATRKAVYNFQQALLFQVNIGEAYPDKSTAENAYRAYTQYLLSINAIPEKEGFKGEGLNKQVFLESDAGDRRYFLLMEPQKDETIRVNFSMQYLNRAPQGLPIDMVMRGGL